MNLPAPQPAANAGPPAPHGAAPRLAAVAGGGASFLTTLNLDRDTAAQAQVSAGTPAAAAKAAPPSEAKTRDAAADAPADAASAVQPGTLAWLINLIGAAPAPAAAIATPAACTPTQDSAAATAPAGPTAANAGKLAASGGQGAASAACPLNPPALPLPAAANDGADEEGAGAHAETAAPLPAAAPHAAEAPSPLATATATATPPVPTAPATLPAAPLPPHQPAFASLLQQAAVDSRAEPPRTALPVEHAEWPAALDQHVRWQLDHGVQEVRLDLHPRDLGSVQVQLRLSASGAEVQFAAAHPHAREALQAALPQLRSLLAADGLHLAQAQVGGQSQSFRPFRPAAAPAFDGDGAESGEGAELPRPRILRIGLVDDYA